MSLVQLLPISGVGSLVSRAADTVADGHSFAEVLLRGGRSTPAGDATPSNATASANLQDAAVRAEEALSALGKMAEERLAAAGVDTSLPIELENDGFGRIIASGDHPDRALIEQVFATDAELSSAFRKASSQVALLELGIDPEASPTAAELPYANLFDAVGRYDIRLSINGEEAAVLR